MGRQSDSKTRNIYGEVMMVTHLGYVYEDKVIIHSNKKLFWALRVQLQKQGNHFQAHIYSIAIGVSEEFHVLADSAEEQLK